MTYIPVASYAPGRQNRVGFGKAVWAGRDGGCVGGHLLDETRRGTAGRNEGVVMERPPLNQTSFMFYYFYMFVDEA